MKKNLRTNQVMIEDVFNSDDDTIKQLEKKIFQIAEDLNLSGEGFEEVSISDITISSEKQEYCFSQDMPAAIKKGDVFRLSNHEVKYVYDKVNTRIESRAVKEHYLSPYIVVIDIYEIADKNIYTVAPIISLVELGGRYDLILKASESPFNVDTTILLTQPLTVLSEQLSEGLYFGQLDNKYKKGIDILYGTTEQIAKRIESFPEDLLTADECPSNLSQDERLSKLKSINSMYSYVEHGYYTYLEAEDELLEHEEATATELIEDEDYIDTVIEWIKNWIEKVKCITVPEKTIAEGRFSISTATGRTSGYILKYYAVKSYFLSIDKVDKEHYFFEIASNEPLGKKRFIIFNGKKCLLEIICDTEHTIIDTEYLGKLELDKPFYLEIIPE